MIDVEDAIREVVEEAVPELFALHGSFSADGHHCGALWQDHVRMVLLHQLSNASRDDIADMGEYANVASANQAAKTRLRSIQDCSEQEELMLELCYRIQDRVGYQLIW